MTKFRSMPARLARALSPRPIAGAIAAAAFATIAAATAFGQAPPAASGERPSAPAPRPGPLRSETITYDNWILTCQEAQPAPGAKSGARTCWATMRVTDNKANRVILVWMLGRNSKDVPTISLQTPTGVLVREGVDVTLGQSTRRLAFLWCDQAACEASGPYDAAFANDLSTQKEAAVAFKARDGRQVSIKVPLTGTDKVLAALRKG